jgi:hypothetical protein
MEPSGALRSKRHNEDNVPSGRGCLLEHFGPETQRFAILGGRLQPRCVDQYIGLNVPITQRKWLRGLGGDPLRGNSKNDRLRIVIGLSVRQVDDIFSFYDSDERKRHQGYS